MKSQARLSGAVAAIALHAIVIVALLQFSPVRSAITNAAPLMVSLLSAPEVVQKPEIPPKPLPVKPRVQQPAPAKTAPVLTAAPDAPTAVVAPTPPPEPLPVVQEAPPAPITASAPAPAVAKPAPPPVVPPNFNANYLQNPAPAYPPIARRMGQQGKVMLRVLVNTAGAPDKIEIRSSSGSSVLDDAALDAVRRWRFVPARQGEQAVNAWVIVPITFALES
jgi:periplasmic protein TonB